MILSFDNKKLSKKSLDISTIHLLSLHQIRYIS